MASLCLFVLQLSSLFAWRNVRTRTRKKYNLMQEADEANADGDHLARQERQPVACRPRDHVWLLWMIILGCDKVCWDVCLDGHNLTCAWRGWYSRGSSSLRSYTRTRPLGCSVWASCALVWWTGGGSTLGACSFCGMGWTRTKDDVYNFGGG